MKKGYKVADLLRKKRIGVAAENLQELIEKSCHKLGFNARSVEYRLYVAEDGTQVDDDAYLMTLPQQTLFILLKEKEKMVTDFDFYYNIIRSTKKDYLETGLAAQEFLSKDAIEKFKVFQKYIAAADDAKTMLSERIQDPAWFEGKQTKRKTNTKLNQLPKQEERDLARKKMHMLSTASFELLKLFLHPRISTFSTTLSKKVPLQSRKSICTTVQNDSGLEKSEKTKEHSMSKRVKERMRGYYYKTKTALQSSELYIHSKNSRGKQLIDQFLLDLRKLLESKKYNEGYFNRKADKTERLCDETGLFACGGLWNKKNCNYAGDHLINPYRSREERIIFQTWNLDHKIELSRSIIPKILEAINRLYKGDLLCILCEEDFSKCLEADRYYLQIFTRENLKLVHIVCHYKGAHNANSDLYTICKKCFENRGRNIQYKFNE